MVIVIYKSSKKSMFYPIKLIHLQVSFTHAQNQMHAPRYMPQLPNQNCLCGTWKIKDASYQIITTSFVFLIRNDRVILKLY